MKGKRMRYTSWFLHQGFDFDLILTFKILLTLLCRERRLRAGTGEASEIQRFSSLSSFFSFFRPAALTPITHHYGILPHWLEVGWESMVSSQQKQDLIHNVKGAATMTGQKDFDRERFIVANAEVSQSQPHACQTPKPHFSSVAFFPWCRLLVNGTSSSVQQVRRCGGEEVKTSFFISHFRKGEMKIRKSQPQYSLD